MHPLARRFFARVNAERAEESQTAAWLYLTDRDAFQVRQDDAHQAQDGPRLAACLAVAHRHGGLKRKHGRKYWVRLLSLHRYAEAAEILLDPCYADDAPDYWLGLGEALAGTGRLAEAAKAVGNVPDDHPEQAVAGALRDRIRRLLDAETGVEKSLGWRATVGVVDDYFELGLVSQAAPWLIRAAATPTLEPGAVATILDRAETIIALAEPRLALDVLLALKPIAGSGGTADRIDRTAGTLTGGPVLEPAAAEAEDIEICCGLALASAGAWTSAIPILGRIAVRQGAADRARLPLADAVGQQIIEKTRPSFRPAARRKIVDVFPFFDEFMLLQLKLEEMADWVDHFVILESTQTFTGRPKPLHFQERQDEFARFADKIVYVPVEFPSYVDTPWAREFYQRDAALPTLVELCGEDDLVLVTDVDEILRREAIEGFNKPFAIFEMPTYAYYFNLLQVQEARFVRGAVWRAKHLQQIGLSTARLELLSRSKKHRLPDAGWHFTSIRDAADLPTKFASYSHTNRARLTPGYFQALMERIRAGEEPGLVRCELDDHFPQALLRGRERLKAFLL